MRYHGVPVAYLPIVSNKDEQLTTLLLNLAHVDKSQTDPAEAHLSKVLTMQRLRTGFHACIITQVGKLVSKYISNCTHCKKLRASVVPVEISDKWIQRMATEHNGIFHSINLDILGPVQDCKAHQEHKGGKALGPSGNMPAVQCHLLHCYGEIRHRIFLGSTGNSFSKDQIPGAHNN